MDVAAWLGGLGLERYAQAFRDAEITPDVLPELTDADLRELGLPLGPRKAVLKAIRAPGRRGRRSARRAVPGRDRPPPSAASSRSCSSTSSARRR